uniref:NADH-ubiquinone oxidoreductase chain 2 n=1 Tax=Tetratoma fungorum TaxID=296006 RepID=A0A343A440_9CUCU|nr:NADH dehydrogenase subunit 2 [Tetratoma fungorum]AOY39318.1 NADH dehydrogenase subunit 2 [Tetratoma fungorum]
MIFLNTMIMGTLISISAYSWMGMWMGLEINLLSIIPLFNSTKNMFSSESSLKYFLTQAMASLVLLFSIILMMSQTEFISPSMNSSFMMLLNSALLMKLGAAPFHFWFPEVMEGLNWNNCLILLTWQKIAPMILIMNNPLNVKFMVIIILVSLIISSLMSLNQISLRKILTFSSINHIAWMISTMMTSFSIWLLYFVIYSMITLNIILIFNYTNSFYLKQIINSVNYNKTLKFTLMLNFMSLAGLPPFIGFIPKWLTINWMIYNNFYLVAFMLTISTSIILFVYMRIIFSSLLISHFEPKMSQIKINNFWMILINTFTLTSFIIMVLFINMA